MKKGLVVIIVLMLSACCSRQGHQEYLLPYNQAPQQDVMIAMH